MMKALFILLFASLSEASHVVKYESFIVKDEIYHNQVTIDGVKRNIEDSGYLALFFYHMKINIDLSLRNWAEDHVWLIRILSAHEDAKSLTKEIDEMGPSDTFNIRLKAFLKSKFDYLCPIALQQLLRPTLHPSTGRLQLTIVYNTIMPPLMMPELPTAAISAEPAKSSSHKSIHLYFKRAIDFYFRKLYKDAEENLIIFIEKCSSSHNNCQKLPGAIRLLDLSREMSKRIHYINAKTIELKLIHKISVERIFISLDNYVFDMEELSNFIKAQEEFINPHTGRKFAVSDQQQIIQHESGLGETLLRYYNAPRYFGQPNSAL